MHRIFLFSVSTYKKNMVYFYKADLCRKKMAVLSKYNGACTYLIVSPNGKPYVGQAKMFHRRMNGHKSKGKLALINHEKWKAGEGTKVSVICFAIHKYGWENMKITILEIYPEWTQELLDSREQYFIRFYDSLKNGYNCNEGGGGNSGYTFTAEAKAKMMGIGAKPVTSCLIKEEYADGTQLVEFVSYASARDAERKTVVNNAHISACCLKKRKSAGGFLWFFTEENHPPQIIWVGEHVVPRIGDKPRVGKSSHKRKLFSESPSGEKQLHESQLAAGRTLSKSTGKKFDPGNISKCCKGKLNHHHGYTFYFATDEMIEEFEKEQKASKKRKREITEYFNKKSE